MADDIAAVPVSVGTIFARWAALRACMAEDGYEATDAELEEWLSGEFEARLQLARVQSRNLTELQAKLQVLAACLAEDEGAEPDHASLLASVLKDVAALLGAAA